MITFSLEISKILEEVNMQSYYIGESAKKKDIDADVIPTSSDNNDELLVYMDTALSDIGNMIATMSLPDSSYSRDDSNITLNINPYQTVPNQAYILSMLTKSIFDYLVNYIIYKWLEKVSPQLSSLYFQNISPYEHNVLRNMNALVGTVRRRYSPLGI